MTQPSPHQWGRSTAADRVWSQVAGLRPRKAAGRLFLVLQAYVDDSREGGVFVLAGYLASAEEWAAFSEEWEGMLPRASLQPDGSRRFKMTEMAMSPDRMSYVSGFQNIINRHVRFSFAAVILEDDLRRAMSRVYLDDEYRVLTWEGSDWEDPLFVAYHVIMDGFPLVIAQVPQHAPPGEPIDFYFDETPQSAKILRGWEEYISQSPPNRRALYQSMPRFENDEAFLPLQAADFRAWWIRRWVDEGGVGYVGSYDFKIVDNPIPTSPFRSARTKS